VLDPDEWFEAGLIAWWRGGFYLKGRSREPLKIGIYICGAFIIRIKLCMVRVAPWFLPHQGEDESILSTSQRLYFADLLF
jgi:hypothetical protein